ncbi:MAG: GNAT family N-acetyltransferase [FCB group bacterium]|nr:GNAT family N-acetyltransferase [FCB group bacterium]MBL7029289.1 GNAT family N-acetyltransferase [Candidatus Neomarinimicrobiota bacterium]MBL7121840.1 GNAT family N-acetyltransferase [Candidatus Neomarinimicrobiota bacterium]
MIILETKRLLLRRMTLEDNDFILELLNGPKWVKYIGSRDVDTLEQARDYLETRVLPSYEALGFGFYIIERLSDQIRVGNCGLTHRDGMEHADIGYSLLEQYEGQGYAYEAASAVLKYGFETHKLDHIEAIATSNNRRSLHLLRKLGMHYKKMIELPGDDEELMLFGIDAPNEEKSNETH